MPFTPTDFAAVASAAICLNLLYQNSKRSSSSYPLPPGPPRWPIVGSLFSMPNNDEMREQFTEWKNKYGTSGALLASFEVET